MREVARGDKDARFTVLLRHVMKGRLLGALESLRKDAAPGADGVTWRECERGAPGRLVALRGRVQSGRYRAVPSRRVYIPRADGRVRPPGIASLEGKVLQRAVTEVLNAVCGAGFRGFSCGFRAGRSQHDALDALAAGLARKRVHWVLDADARGFFGHLDREWLMRARGNVIIARFADDFTAGFGYQDDAERFPGELRGRLAGFALEPYPDKTRLIGFGPHAGRLRKARGGGKPETFTFLGFRRIARMARRGRFWVQRITDAKKMTAKLKQVKAELMRRRLPVPEQGKWLASVVRGRQGYCAVPGNGRAAGIFRYRVIRLWRRAPGRAPPERRHHLGPDEPHRQPLPAPGRDQASLA